MATINTIEKHFDEMTLEQRKANLTALNYIKMLASSTNTDIKRWDILHLFGSGDGANLQADKKSINKIFFAKLEKLADRKSDDYVPIELPNELTQAIENGFRQNLEHRKKEIQHTINDQMRQFSSYNRHLNAIMAQVVELRKQIAQVDGSKDPIAEIKRELQEILKEGIWVNPVIHDGHLYLNTNGNIVLTLKNEKANQDLTFDAGQFAVQISLGNFYMKVIPYKNNSRVNYDRFYHPHVDLDGDICWGNARESALASLELFQIGKALKLLYAVLSQYNDGNPYVHLSEFVSDKRRYGRIPANLRHPDRIRDRLDESDEAEARD